MLKLFEQGEKLMFYPQSPIDNGPSLLAADRRGQQWDATRRAALRADRLFEAARLRAWFGRLAARLLHRPCCPEELASAVRGRRVIQGSDLGVRAVPVRQIIGSESRCQDFDSQFRPRHERMRQRWASVASLMEQGASLPAVELVQIGERYFVRDGHHRVSAARALGYSHLDAHVVVWRLEAQPEAVRAYQAGAERWQREAAG